MLKLLKLNNLFWLNNSHKVPNRIPNLEGATERELTPIFDSPITGTCVIYGEWNYCVYNHTPYFLEKLSTLAIDENGGENKYKYRLIKDHGCSLLRSMTKVRGRVNVWNVDKDLEAHLQFCRPVLSNPCRLLLSNLDEVNFDWKQHIQKIKYGGRSFQSKVVTKEAFYGFTNDAKSYAVKSGRDFKDKFGTHGIFAGPSKQVDLNARRPINIFGYLEGLTVDDGRQEVINKISEDLDEAWNNRVITKVKSPALSDASPLLEKYAVTHKNKSIGLTEEEGVSLISFDLSGLTDIVPLNEVTLKVDAPNKPLTEETGVFTIRDGRHRPDNYRILLKRRAYLPIKTPFNNFNYFPGSTSRNFYCNPPQKIKLRSPYSVEGYLWWADKNDICLSSYDPEDGTLRPLISRNNGRNSLQDSLKDDNVHYGFLIYQMYKEPGLWDKYIYKGNSTIKEHGYYAGFNEQFWNRYHESKDKKTNGFNFLPESIQAMAGARVFSSLQIDYNLLTWLYGTPTIKDYKYSYSYDREDLRKDGLGNRSYYIYDQVNQDFQPPGADVIINPFSPEKIGDFHNRRKRIINNVLIRENLDLPGEISKGDYLFSDMEYVWGDIPQVRPIASDNSLTSGWETAGQYLGLIFLAGGGLFVTYNTSEKIEYAAFQFSYLLDFMSPLNRSMVDHLDNCIVLCSSEERKLQIRPFMIKKLTLSLSDRTDQIVEKVDESTNRNITFYYMPKFIEASFVEKGWKPSEVNALLYMFYKTNGINVSTQSLFIGSDTFSSKFTGYTKEDLEGKTEHNKILFDLVGTDGYALFFEGKIHYISKKSEIFEPKISKINHLIPLEKDIELTLIDKVNQLNYLHLGTTTRTLNTKFSFKPNEMLFSVRAEQVDQADSNTNIDYIHIESFNKFDVINEGIEIPKKELAIAQTMDKLSFDNLKVTLDRINENKEITMRNLEFDRERLDEEIRRRRGDINYSLARTVLGTVPHVNIPLTYRELQPGTKEGTITKETTKLGSSSTGKAVTQINEKYMPVKPTGALRVSPLTGLDFAMNLSVHRPELLNRIKIDEHFANTQILLKYYEADLDYERRKADSLRTINSLTSRIIKPNVNDRVLIEKYNQRKKLNNINIHTYIPTKEQAILLKDHKDEFGVDCDIPDMEFNIFSGMPPNVVRYEGIEDDGLIGSVVEDKIEREVLRSRLLNGIKVIDYAESERHYPCGYVDTSHLEDEIQELKEKLSTSESTREKELTTLNNRYHELSESYRAKESELTQEKNKYILCQGELTTLRQEKNELTEKVNNLESDKQDLDEELETLNKQVKEAEDREEKLKKDLEECKAELSIEVSKPKLGDKSGRVNAGNYFTEQQMTCVVDKFYDFVLTVRSRVFGHPASISNMDDRYPMHSHEYKDNPALFYRVDERRGKTEYETAYPDRYKNLSFFASIRQTTAENKNPYFGDLKILVQNIKELGDLINVYQYGSKYHLKNKLKAQGCSLDPIVVEATEEESPDDLKPANKPFYFSSEQYRDYKNLSLDEWENTFNITNFWHLTGDEMNNYVLLLAVAFHSGKVLNSQEYRQKIKDIIDIIHDKRKNKYFQSGTYLAQAPGRWDRINMAQLKEFRTRAPAFMQYLRTSGNQNTNVVNSSSVAAIKNAFNQMIEKNKKMTTQDGYNEDKFKEFAILANTFGSYFLGLNPSLKLFDGIPIGALREGPEAKK